MPNSSSDSDEDSRVSNINNLLLKSFLNDDLSVDFGQAHKKKHGDLIFDASYEGANLGRVDQVGQHEYDLFIRPDVANPRFRIWFNFTVQNTKLNQCVIFNIVNLSEEIKFFYEGFTPVVRSQLRHKWLRMRESQVFYYRCPKHKLRPVLSLTFRFDNQEDIYQFAFNYPYTWSKLQSHLEKWSNICNPSHSTPVLSPAPDWNNHTDISEDEVSDQHDKETFIQGNTSSHLRMPESFFQDHRFISTRRLSQATCSLSDLTEGQHHGRIKYNHSSIKHSLDRTYNEQGKNKPRRHRRKRENRKPINASICFKSTIVARSHMNRPIIELFITDIGNECSCEKQILTNQSPDLLIGSSSELASRKAFITSKKTIIILSRVHPSGSPASFACHGLIDFLLDAENKLATLARKFFKFIIYPMIDPDSVSAGNSRTSILGHDLNKYWSESNDLSQPNIFAIKQKLIGYLSLSGEDIYKGESSELKITEQPAVMILDIHANIQNHGASISGKLYDDIVRMERHALFPKLLSSIAPDFYIGDCIFYDHDEIGGLNEFIAKYDTNIDCYTLEISHFGHYNKSSLGQDICHYDQESYMDLGKCIIHALIDLDRHTGHIPVSHIPLELQQLLDSYHAQETEAFKLSLIRNID